jgi:hypothetical protein
MTSRSARKLAGLVGIAAAVSTALLAQSPDVPLRNWTVPPYTAMGAGGSLTTMADISDPVAFVPIDPCRVADTRGLGFSGQAGPPLMTANMTRTFQIADIVPGVPVPCGVPVGAKAVSFYFTVIQPNSDGNLIAWPSGPAPTSSVLNWAGGIFALGNGTIIPLGGNSINVFVNAPNGATTHLVIDVNGYFTDTYNANQMFRVNANIGGLPALWATNTNATTGSIGVRGTTTGLGRSYGVLGTSASNPNGSAGVKGIQGTEHAEVVNQLPAGVVGSSQLFDGVSGISFQGSGGAGVHGVRLSAGGEVTSSGELGVANLGGSFVNDVEINGDLEVLNDGVHGPGNITKDGTVSFIEPHPTDASKAIRYVALEGPEAGTYFRGRARFENGLARIPVPDTFRFVTAEEGLTAQVTPIGAMATVAVVKMDLNEIVVRSSRNVEFSYLVQGVRNSFADYQPIVEARVRYAKAGAGARLSNGLRPEIRRRLIANGSYNEDGTINMETARRLGWDRIWAERGEGPAPEPLGE